MDNPQTPEQREKAIQDRIDANTRWYTARAESDAGEAEAHLAVTSFHDPIVDLVLRWRTGDCEGSRPDVWQITWVHHPAIIWRNLPRYLHRYSPAPKAIWEAVEGLELPESVRNAIKSGE
jgi:hypothetical protein